MCTLFSSFRCPLGGLVILGIVLGTTLSSSPFPQEWLLVVEIVLLGEKVKKKHTSRAAPQARPWLVSCWLRGLQVLCVVLVLAHRVELLRTLRLDGFVGVHADGKGGELITKPLMFEGKKLALNFATSAAGGVAVEIQDESGAPLPGYALSECPVFYGDEIEYVVRWKDGSDVSGLVGRPVRLRFRMRDADLYSIRFRNHE